MSVIAFRLNSHTKYVYTKNYDSRSTAPYKLEGIEATQNNLYYCPIELYAILGLLFHRYGPQISLILNNLTSSWFSMSQLDIFNAKVTYIL